jgi:hypothetical protein
MADRSSDPILSRSGPTTWVLGGPLVCGARRPVFSQRRSPIQHAVRARLGTAHIGSVNPMPSVHPRHPVRDRKSPSRGYLFVREGEYWTIAFDGTVSRFRHSRGLQHLSRLLRAPGTPIPASELAGGGRDPDRRQSPSSPWPPSATAAR